MVKIFVFCDWQENLWAISFRGCGSVSGTIVVGFAKYTSYCGLISVDKRYAMKSKEINIPQKFLQTQYLMHCFKSIVVLDA